jgi:hypothetical protein
MNTNVYEVVSSVWPVFIGLITLVIILSKMHSSIMVLEDKVKVLFDLFNNRDRRS